MKRTALSLAVLCSLLLTACSTAEIPQTVPENSTSYDQTASYAQNLGRQFGILKISDGMTGAEQCSRVRTESHLARNLGVTLLANSPLQDLSKSVSKGPFSTGVGLDFANLGWKNDTVYFENLDHWFAFVPQQKYLSKEAAQSYTVQALAEATVAVFSQNSYVVDDIRTSELEQSGDTLRQSVQIKLVNETVGCSKSSPCRIVFTSHFSENEPMKPADWVVQTQKLDDGKHWKFWATSFESDLKQTPASEQTRLWESVSERLPNGFSLYFAPRQVDKGLCREAKLMSHGKTYLFSR